MDPIRQRIIDMFPTRQWYGNENMMWIECEAGTIYYDGDILSFHGNASGIISFDGVANDGQMREAVDTFPILSPECTFTPLSGMRIILQGLRSMPEVLRDRLIALSFVTFFGTEVKRLGGEI